MDIDEDRFEIRLARSETDVAAAQRLRYRVFVEELGARAADADHARRLEADRFDPVFDHLIMIDRTLVVPDPLDRVVGVYRLLPAARAAAAGGFYGAQEYDLAPLERSGRRLLELGRSCLAPQYRGGAALHLMWRALGAYVRQREIDLLFGVASFHGTDVGAYAEALSYLHHRHLAPADIRVTARADAGVSMNILPAQEVDRRRALAAIPQLIKAYLRLGGFVGEGAYVDQDFNTIDVCLVMDTERMVTKHKARYAEGAALA